MRVRYGDLWENFPQELVVIPTNLGWRTDGCAVMGAGIAAQAAARFPDLPEWYGYLCKRFREDTPVLLHPQHRLILFPTKPYDETAPWLSWKADSDVKLVWRSAAQLAAFTFDETISIPLVGCGHGKLTPDIVLPILKTFCNHNRFQIVAPASQRVTIDGILHGKWNNWLLYQDPRPTDSGLIEGTHLANDHGNIQ